MYRIERLMENWINIADFYKIKSNYVITLFLSVVLAYFSIIQILKFPKPETFGSFVQYYLSDPPQYLLSLGLILLTSISLIIQGAATTTNAVRIHEDIDLYWTIPMAFFGVALVLGSFYFINYFFILLIVLVVLGLAILGLASSSDSSRRR